MQPVFRNREANSFTWRWGGGAARWRCSRNPRVPGVPRPGPTSTRCDKPVRRIGYGSHGPLTAQSLKVDPTKPELYTGMLNTGHTFGDDLTEEQRLAVLEFCKCL